MASLVFASSPWSGATCAAARPLPLIGDLRALALKLAHDTALDSQRHGRGNASTSAASRAFGGAANSSGASTNGTACRVASGLHGVLLELQNNATAGAALDAAAKAAAMTRLSSAASVTACAGRARHDIAENAAADVATMMGTEWATTIIKTIAPPIVMAILSPFVLAFISARARPAASSLFRTISHLLPPRQRSRVHATAPSAEFLMPAVNEQMVPKIVDGAVDPIARYMLEHLRPAHRTPRLDASCAGM